MEDWSVDDVVKYLQDNGFGDYETRFREEEVDGATLIGLTETMVSKLLPTMKLQVKFRNLLEFKEEQPANEMESSLSSSASAVATVSYTLPKFVDEVRCYLKPQYADKFKIGSKLRSLMIDTIYNDLIASKCLYPSRLVYGDVCSAIVLKYPFLADYDGTANSWHFALRRKYKRSRQPLVREGTVAEMRAKYGRPGMSGRKRRRTDNDTVDDAHVHKIARFKETALDNALMGEDERSIQKHIQAMQRECKKKEPDISVIKDCMKRTAAFRQQFCHQNSTQSVLETFPSLQMKRFFVADAKLLYDLDCYCLASQLLSIYDRVLKEAPARCKDYAKLIDELHRQLEDASEDAASDLKTRICLRLLTSLFAEDFSAIYVEREEENVHLTPCIVGSCNVYQVHVDKCHILGSATKSFRSAVEVWFSAFWVFSIRYAKTVSKTCEFLEKILLNKPPKPSAIVRKWANRLSGGKLSS